MNAPPPDWLFCRPNALRFKGTCHKFFSYIVSLYPDEGKVFISVIRFAPFGPAFFGADAAQQAHNYKYSEGRRGNPVFVDFYRAAVAKEKIELAARHEKLGRDLAACAAKHGIVLNL